MKIPVLGLGLAMAMVAPAYASEETCEALAGTEIAGAAINGAQMLSTTEGLPLQDDDEHPVVETDFCRVQASIEDNIELEVWLPSAELWNDRLLTAGVGGNAGHFNFVDMALRLEEGFATMSTDSGHKIENDEWMQDPKLRADYEHRATHLSTVAAQGIIDRFYGEPAGHSYFLGCSGGGRQGLKEVQMYPDDYDGVISGAPGSLMPLITIRMMWSGLQQANSDTPLTNEDWALYESAVVQQCDGQDGVIDGVVSDPPQCEFDIASITCSSEDGEMCLAPGKAELLATIISPMTDENGVAIDEGLLPGVRTRPGPPSPLVAQMFQAAYDDPDWSPEDFVPSKDYAQFQEVMPDIFANNPDISQFEQSEGKLLIYQGWQDPSTIANPQVAYFEELAEEMGGFDAVDDTARMFMVPGMHHCRGGPGVDTFGGAGQGAAPNDPERDILWAMIEWVENGRAPDELIAIRSGEDGVAMSRKLCPYPQVAELNEGASGEAAEDYTCVSPQ